jgi:WD40 repeat protein
MVLGVNPRQVDVPAWSPINFFVTCTPRGGTVHVAVNTTGTDLDADGYRVTVTGDPNGPQSSARQVAMIPTNGSLDIRSVPEGSASVQLDALAGNCAVVGADPQTVSVQVDQTVNAAFSVQCTQAGAISVTTTTTGSFIDPDAYSVEVRRPDDSVGVRYPITTNGTLKITGLLGNYVLTAFDVASNCDVADSNPRPVAVSSGSQTPVAFTVRCGAPVELAFVIGAPDNIYLGTSAGSIARMLTSGATANRAPAWSPDGAHIAFTSERDGGDREIYVMNADGTGAVRLTSVQGLDDLPSWSPDGTKIAFLSERGGGSAIYVMNADGTNQVRLIGTAGYVGSPTWSPDGSKIAFASSGAKTDGIWIVDSDGRGPVRLTTASDVEPAWAPDGSRIAFSGSRANNNGAIFLINVDGSGLTQITHGIDNAGNPSWSPDGRKIAIDAMSNSCGYYDYYNECAQYIVIISTTGVPFTSIAGSGFDPAWRP